MALDKNDYIYIALLAIGILSFFIWQFGSYSSNIQQTELINQTQMQLHQDQITKNQTKHEDDARFNQSQLFRQYLAEKISELDAKLTSQIVRENNTTHKILVNQGTVINKLNESLENQNIMLNHVYVTIEQNKKDIAMNLNVSKQHEQVAKDHNEISNNVSNVTKQIDDKLYMYGENSLDKFDVIVENQKEIIKLLTNNNMNISKNK